MEYFGYPTIDWWGGTHIIDECDEVGYEVDYRTKDFIVCRNEKLGKSYIRAKHEFIEEWCSYI